MVGHGGILAFDDAHGHARRRRATCCTSAPPRAAASASRAGSACAARTRCSPTARPVDASTPRGAAGDARARQPVRPRRRHAGADPQPARRTSPTSWGSHDARAHDRRRDGRGRGRHDGPRGRARRRRAESRRSASTSARPRSAPAASASSASRARPGPLPSCTTPCRDGMVVDTRDATARRVAGAVVELVLSELPAPPGRAHRARRRSRATLGVGEPRWPGAHARRRATTSATRTSPSSTSCASRAGAACARATRSRARSR